MDHKRVKFIVVIFLIPLLFLLGTIAGLYFGIPHLLRSLNTGTPRSMNYFYASQSAEELARAESEFKNAKSDYDRWLALTDLGFWEVDANEFDEARKHAEDLQAMSAKYVRDWNYGNAEHKVNLTLGRLALREGDIAKAKEYLLKAGKTRGSPQLNSFGPNMTLAKELLEKGEKEVVLEYFDECEKFWEMGGEMKYWRMVIKSGGTPDFGANLIY